MSDNFYNKNVKEKFLEKFQEESRNTYSHVFKKSEELEQLIGIDLYLFKINQIEALLKKFKFSTIKAARTYFSVISSYINWSIENGYKTDENPVKDLGDDWLGGFVVENKTIFTDKEVEYIEDNLVNFQDKVIPRLLFEGVGLQELLNLTNLDIDEDENILTLKDSDLDIRKLKVSDRAIHFIINASKEKEYRLKNGESTGKRTVSDLVTNNFIVKSSIGKSLVNYDQADKHLIYRRLSMMSSLFKGYGYFNVNNIAKSGKLKMARDFYLQFGFLDDGHLIRIQDHFGYKSKIKTNYDFFRLESIKTYVNTKMILDLYE
ncbi:hypothetical protein [Peribacillus loiseleuriae]|uniref:phage lytic cycle repressor MrpR family protein n=1 Tax=Peribacillus loiseleuriae TaxID=1679170 RepID=UPI003CFCCB19